MEKEQFRVSVALASNEHSLIKGHTDLVQQQWRIPFSRQLHGIEAAAHVIVATLSMFYRKYNWYNYRSWYWPLLIFSFFFSRLSLGRV
jgi:hypothetical protein